MRADYSSKRNVARSRASAGRLPVAAEEVFVGGDPDFRAEAELAASVRLMHVLGLQPLDQCGVHDADTLAFAAGEVDIDGPPAPRQ